MKTKFIGEIIEEEVRRQQFSIKEFAERIDCKRNNVYNIFRRNNIDIDLLKRISNVLKHNYFKDIAEDMNLASPKLISEEEQKRLCAVNQFLEVVPKSFEKLNLDVAIVLGVKKGVEKDIPLPDFILSDFNITFTIGQTYEERCNGFWGNTVRFQKVDYVGAVEMVEYINQIDGIEYVDIAIDYKTQEEWDEAISFILDEIRYLYHPRTLNYLNELRRQCRQ